MKNFLLTIFLTLLIALPVGAIGFHMNYDIIYENLPEIKNTFLNAEDPKEVYENQRFCYSPYPLIRIWSELQVKKEVIKPGYYLLSPGFVKGYNVILLKQHGKIKHIVPVYEKQKVDPLKIYREQKVKPKWYQLPYKAFVKCLKIIFFWHKNPPPPPKFLLKSYDLKGPYYSIDLYYESYLYKTLYKKKKY